MTLRDYQEQLAQDVHKAWEDGHAKVMAVMPTGAGKTVTMTEMAERMDCPTLAIAHRQELVAQISLAFARQGIPHRIIAPAAVQRAVIEQHVEEVGRNWVHPGAHAGVAGVDTLIKRQDAFFDRVEAWQIDEAHHVQADNKWGQATAMLPAARRGIGWTATPLRTDRRALAIFDTMVVGPTMRELIDRGYLAEYRIWSLPQSIDTTGVKVTGGGEFNGAQLAAAAHESQITGDIVAHYLRLAAGKSGVTFAVDVAMATEHVDAFNAAGVPAAVLHAKTPAAERVRIIRAFRAGTLKQIVNVDVLGEGFDCPGIEVTSFARPTMSYGLYVQQFGRALRPKEGKPCGMILDHVGNVPRHGLPDKGRAWTLEGPPKKEACEVPIRVCCNPECMRPFEGFTRGCPFCGWEPTPGTRERSRPEAVEGDLTLYTPELIAQLRGEIDRIANMEGPLPTWAGVGAIRGAEKSKRVRAEAQAELADAIDAWAGIWHHGHGEPLHAVYRRFWHTFGVDTLGALTQSGPAMREMVERVKGAGNA